MGSRGNLSFGGEVFEWVNLEFAGDRRAGLRRTSGAWESLGRPPQSHDPLAGSIVSFNRQGAFAAPQ
eukprot:3308635-Pyramimonas_sp.AAC.1